MTNKPALGGSLVACGIAAAASVVVAALRLRSLTPAETRTATFARS